MKNVLMSVIENWEIESVCVCVCVCMCARKTETRGNISKFRLGKNTGTI